MRRWWRQPLWAALSVWRFAAALGMVVGEEHLRPNDDANDDAGTARNVIELGTHRADDLRRPAVSVVIPAFNEEESIDWVLQQLPPWVSEVVLIDGLSTDRTEAIARKLRPDIIVVHQRQRGKGAALRAGFAAARGDIIAMMDADGSTDPAELETFVAALEAGADFVKGSRILTGGGSVDLTPIRKAGNLGFVLLVNRLYGSRFTDLCYGYCAFWRRHLDALRLRADGFEIETELALNAVRAGLKIREVPSMELARRGGASNLRAFSDGKRVLNTILRHRLNRGARAITTSSPIELIALDPAASQTSTVYLALAPRRPAPPTEPPGWLGAMRATITPQNRSVAGAARTALPWALSTVLLVRQRGPATRGQRTRRGPGAQPSRRTRSSRAERARPQSAVSSTRRSGGRRRPR